MKKQNQTTSKLRNAARNEVKTVNTNPTYIFRSLNKLAAGTDKQAREVDGYSNKAIKALYTRLNETFACGGFWWSSVYAVNGRLVISIKPVELGRVYNVDEAHTIITFAGVRYYARLATTWSPSTVITSAALRLGLVEKYAKCFEKSEKKAGKAVNLANTIAELTKKVAAGTITEVETYKVIAVAIAA